MNLMKKKILFLNVIIICLVISIIGIGEVKALKNPYKKMSSFGRNCTWYAWQHVHDKAGISLPGWGNASTWYESAKKAGFSVGKTPKAKSIAVWSWVSGGKDYGHVGYVERVKGDKIYVWENNDGCVDVNDKEYVDCIANGVSEETDRICLQNAKRVACEYDATYWSEPGDLVGYIYLDAKPKTTKKETTTRKTTTSTTTPSIKIKSNNANLAELTVSNIDINFDKNTLEYKIDVDNEITSVVIEAKTEDNLASITGSGTHDLSVGENTIEISVKAEDESVKIYTLKINRKAINTTSESITSKQTNKDNEKKNNANLTIYLIVGITGLVIISLLIVILSKRNKKI
ncbi:MAG: CHAP domain-containing protein [Bacilli bacterium]|nr:CHAP domain-containing protein [Bacilli bacterium]